HRDRAHVRAGRARRARVGRDGKPRQLLLGLARRPGRGRRDERAVRTRRDSSGRYRAGRGGAAAGDVRHQARERALPGYARRGACEPLTMLPDSSHLALFLSTTVVLLLIPGPAVLYIVAQSVEHGRRAGLTAVGGIHVGSGVHVAAATVGLSALLVSSAV